VCILTHRHINIPDIPISTNKRTLIPFLAPDKIIPAINQPGFLVLVSAIAVFLCCNQFDNFSRYGFVHTAESKRRCVSLCGAAITITFIEALGLPNIGSYQAVSCLTDCLDCSAELDPTLLSRVEARMAARSPFLPNRRCRYLDSFLIR
jgi:hypothetical protein